MPDNGLLCDLLWSDPDKDVLAWGDNERGVCIVYDGVFEVLGAPSYKYYIHPENEELPSPFEFDARTANTTREAVLDRLHGRPYGTTKREDSND